MTNASRRDRSGNINATANHVPFQPAGAKLTLSSVDEPEMIVVAQYNPKELQLDRSIGWAPHPTTDKTGKTGKDLKKDLNAGMHLEFGGTTPRSLTIELLFDGAETKGRLPDAETTTASTPATGRSRKVVSSVADMVDVLEALATVRDPSATKPRFRRPHLCVAVWGQGGMRPFRCVIESVSTKIQMFSSSGTALRASCTIKLKEADVVGIREAEAKAEAEAEAAKNRR